MRRLPDIDLSRCVCCQGCEEICPEVFHLNPAGYMEVVVRDDYPDADVDEAISICPQDCISWLERG